MLYQFVSAAMRKLAGSGKHASETSPTPGLQPERQQERLRLKKQERAERALERALKELVVLARHSGDEKLMASAEKVDEAESVLYEILSS